MSMEQPSSQSWEAWKGIAEPSDAAAREIGKTVVVNSANIVPYDGADAVSGEVEEYIISFLRYHLPA